MSMLLAHPNTPLLRLSQSRMHMPVYTAASDFSYEAPSLILLTTAYGSDLQRWCDYLLRRGQPSWHTSKELTTKTEVLSLLWLRPLQIPRSSHRNYHKCKMSTTWLECSANSAFDTSAHTDVSEFSENWLGTKLHDWFKYCQVIKHGLFEWTHSHDSAQEHWKLNPNKKAGLPRKHIFSQH